MNQDSSSRRRFLQTGAAATSVLVLGGAAARVAEADAAFTAPETIKDGAKEVVIDSEKHKKLLLKLGDHAPLAKPGGSEIFDVGGDKVIVVHKEDGGYAACSAICPHKGCEVAYNAQDKTLVCPCHRAKFGLDGKVISGPARRDLKGYASDAAVAVELG